MIKTTPKTPNKLGISCKINIAIIIPTTDLYELIGPKTESSPICRAFTKQALPTEHNNPAVIA